jgi:hypothetical protein
VLRRLAALGFACSSLAALGACGSSDSGSDTQTISNAKIPFTFEVPKDFKKTPVSPGSSQGAPPIVAYSLDKLNLIDVRQSATKQLPLDSVATQITKSLAQLGFASEQGKREKHGDTDMVVFSVDNKVGGTKTNSTLYFFTGGGGTWEIECQSTPPKADQVTKACTTAVDSVKFTK